MKIPSAYYLDIPLSTLLLVTLSLHYTGIFGSADHFVLIAVAVVGIIPVLYGVYKSIRRHEWVSMDMLASVALLFSLLSQEWASAIFIELMLAAARILYDITRDRTEKSIQGLLKLRPKTTHIERGDKLEEIQIEDIKIDDIVVVDIGERIPVDGIVVSGSAAIDESALTGESAPVEKESGSNVFSSTLVQSGSLRICTTHIGKDTTLERIIHLVEFAREQKPYTQTLGEKFGTYYLIFIFTGSMLIYLFTQNLPLVLAVVLVVCADDIAIAVPISYLRAIREMARIGVIVKGAKDLEVFGQTQILVIDKTGTLTTGRFEIANVFTEQGYTERDVLQACMLTGIRSSHPLSRAVIAFAKQRKIPETFPDTVEEHGGRGVLARKDKDTYISGRQSFIEESEATISRGMLENAQEMSSQGKTISFIAKNGEVIGFVAASDEVKGNAKKALSDLRTLGIKRIVMLTGDNERVAQSVAEELNVDEWHANLLPENKLEIIRRLQIDGSVAMVGDGVNDAAALSVADVGIAMGALGTEGAIESAQIVLMHDNLSMLPTAMQIARVARKVSVQDFWIWGTTNAVGLTLVFGGIIGPSGAAAYNFLSDFLPLSNSLRVRIGKNKQ